jgi:hypothetical protein
MLSLLLFPHLPGASGVWLFFHETTLPPYNSMPSPASRSTIRPWAAALELF